MCFNHGHIYARLLPLTGKRRQAVISSMFLTEMKPVAGAFSRNGLFIKVFPCSLKTTVEYPLMLLNLSTRTVDLLARRTPT